MLPQLLLLSLACLPLYLLRFSVFGLPTNLFEVLVVSLFLLALFEQKKLTFKHPLFLWTTILLTSATLSTLLTQDPSAYGQLKSFFFLPYFYFLLFYSVFKTNPFLRFRALQVLSLLGAFLALLSFKDLGVLPRLQAFYDVPNSLALFLLPIAFLSLSQPQLFFKLLSGIIIISLVFTQSVGALAALLFTLLLSSLLTHRFSFKGLLVPLIILLAGTSFFTLTGRLSYFLVPMYNNSVHSSLSVRLQLWDISFSLIKQHPVLGLGLGQFEPAYQQELHKRFENCKLKIVNCSPLLNEFVFRDPHNWFLAWWLNTGFFGLLAFISLAFLSLRRGVKAFPLDPVARGATFALIATLLYGLVDTIYWKNDLAALYWLLLALLLTAPAPREAPQAPPRS
jgi:O-antigen ligase